ncbi:MAG: 1,4-alpha-glucan branching enzyme [Verrucomicrobia bacterium CG1_02_43_26]|nr:MAG: 1,4-alpha-glucan branching enzyme [Verrucomicrobia bacterium CG1_02_43_26]
MNLLEEKEHDLIVRARHNQPHSVLGMHPVVAEGKKGIVIRTFVPGVKCCEIVEYKASPEKRYKMECLDEQGLFEVVIPEKTDVFPYRIRVEQDNGEIRQYYDPYSFLPTLTDEDLHLFNEGNHHRVYEKLGAHPREISGIKGFSFAVWAPAAYRVSVVGDFNHWDGRCHTMRTMGSSGIWEIFIPGIESGLKYKYEIIDRNENVLLKSDPYAVYYESAPHNASVTWDLGGHTWHDANWIKKREKTNWQEKPISVYEVHHGSWKRIVDDGNRSLSYEEMADELVTYVKRMGFTHVEFMPLAEHPFAGSWGYQVTGFFAPTHRFGTPQGFMYLVDKLHQNDIGVIVDWVPGHFPKDAFALADFDGTNLYEHSDPRQGHHQDWGTLIFNYGRHEVRNFLICSALAWFDRFHIDGMRVDAVASMLYLDYSRDDGQWIPNQYGGKENIEAMEFLRSSNDLVHKYYPGSLMIAEESTAFGGVTKPTSEYGLGYDFKWNMGWMHDNLLYFSKDPIYRKWHHNNLTFGMLYQYSENFITVFSHDEVVHGKGSLISKMSAWSMPEKAQTLRSLYAYMWSWPGKKTLFMGCEFGQSNEWYYDTSLDWHLLQYKDHEGVQKVVQDLNWLYQNSPALAKFDNSPEGFQWINGNDGENSVLSFLRMGEKPEETLLIVGNFTPVGRNQYRLGVPYKGKWKECINTNATVYGGNGDGNLGGLVSEDIAWDGREQSLLAYLPPLSTIIFQYSPEKE